MTDNGPKDPHTTPSLVDSWLKCPSCGAPGDYITYGPEQWPDPDTRTGVLSSEAQCLLCDATWEDRFQYTYLGSSTS